MAARTPFAQRPQRLNGSTGQGVDAAISLHPTTCAAGRTEDIGEILDWLCAEERPSATARRKAEAMMTGILGDVAGLDAIIQQYAPALPVNLLAIVDRNILRVAIYELTASKRAPGRVIISEAADLASMFGSESSARFVSGVLGSVLNDLPDTSEAAVTQSGC